MIVGIAALFAVWKLRWRSALFIVPAIAVVYIGTAVIDSQIPIRPTMINASRLVFGDDRAGSLETRFRNEVFLVDRAQQRPLLGWGGWGDYRGDSLGWQSDHGRVLTDGFWVVALGQRGYVGVFGLYACFLLPGVVAVMAAIRARLALGPFLIVAGLALFTWVYALDLLFNGFPSPLQAVVAGALVSMTVAAIGRPPLRGEATDGLWKKIDLPAGRQPKRPATVGHEVS